MNKFKSILPKLSNPILWVSLFGAFKIILQTVNITIPDAQINSMANGIAGLMVVIGIFMDHGQKPPDQSSTNQING